MLFSNRFNIDARLSFVAVAIVLAIAMHLSGFDRILATDIHSLGNIGSLIIGAFYTFGLTTPTAFIIILEIMAANDAISTATVAALSAAAVDTTFFVLLRNQLERNAEKFIGMIRKKFGRLNKTFPIIGFFVFGSPLPDELGLALMEITEIKPMKIFIIIFLAKLLTLLLAYKTMTIL